MHNFRGNCNSFCFIGIELILGNQYLALSVSSIWFEVSTFNTSSFQSLFLWHKSFILQKFWNFNSQNMFNTWSKNLFWFVKNKNEIWTATVPSPIDTRSHQWIPTASSLHAYSSISNDYHFLVFGVHMSCQPTHNQSNLTEFSDVLFEMEPLTGSSNDKWCVFTIVLRTSCEQVLAYV